MSIIVDDTFHCTRSEMEEFGRSRVWREIKSWIEERRSGVADMMDSAKDETAFRLLQRERQVLRDLLELPELVMATLDVRDANESRDEENENVDDEQRSATDRYPG